MSPSRRIAASDDVIGLVGPRHIANPSVYELRDFSIVGARGLICTGNIHVDDRTLARLAEVRVPYAHTPGFFFRPWRPEINHPVLAGPEEAAWVDERAHRLSGIRGERETG